MLRAKSGSPQRHGRDARFGRRALLAAGWVEASASARQAGAQDHPPGGPLKQPTIADVAPTLLAVMGQEQPAEMTGQSLIDDG